MHANLPLINQFCFRLRVFRYGLARLVSILNLNRERRLSRPSAEEFPAPSRDLTEFPHRDLIDREIEESTLAWSSEQEQPDHLVVVRVRPREHL